MMKKLVVVLVVALMGVPSIAAVVFSDDFQDGNRDGWYLTSGGNLSVVDDSSGIGTGNAMDFDVNSSSTQRRMIANFEAVELADIGYSMTLSFDFRITGTGDAKEGFRFGLFNSMGTLQTADATSGSSSSNAADDQGYFARISVGSESQARLSEDKASGTSFMGGTDLSNHATDTAFGGIDDDLTHTAVFTVTRMASTNSAGEPLDIPVLELLIDGTKNMIDIDGDRASPRWTFDEVGFAGTNRQVNFVIDNVSVDYVVPEPATISLMILGGISALWKRKRS